MQSWSKIKCACADGHKRYKFAAESIHERMTADTVLTQKNVAKLIGKSEAWVSALLKWYRNGCAEGSIFLGEHSAERQAKIQPAKPRESASVTDEELGQLCLLGGNSTHVAGERTATLTGLNALATCRNFSRVIHSLSRESLRLVLRSSSTSKRRSTLEKLASELRKSIAAGEAALVEVRAALKHIPPDLKTAEAA